MFAAPTESACSVWPQAVHLKRIPLRLAWSTTPHAGQVRLVFAGTTHSTLMPARLALSFMRRIAPRALALPMRRRNALSLQRHADTADVSRKADRPKAAYSL